ncbi:MAG TPA: helix-turn-helix domain-containing protein [Methylomirabilota bacterium]|nr:helix-turn-helix domain-containing protein [Methylomirabilota bacterium]
MGELDAVASVGPYLRSLREAKGATLEDIARATRVGLRHLEALESDRHEELPASVFVKGFIRAYCEFLGEAPEPVLARYRATVGETLVAEPRPAPSRTSATRRPGPVVVSLALVAVFGGSLLALNLALKRNPRPAVESVPVSGPSEPANARAAGQSPSAVARSAPAAAPVAPPLAPQGHRLVIKAVEPTWVRVQTDDGRVAEELLPPGATREWTSPKRFLLTVGNAGGVELELDGRTLPPLGARGQVIQRLELPQPEAASGS